MKLNGRHVLPCCVEGSSSVCGVALLSPLTEAIGNCMDCGVHSPSAVVKSLYDVHHRIIILQSCCVARMKGERCNMIVL